LEAAEKQLKQLDEQLAAEHRTRKVAGEEAMVERLDQAAKVVKDLEREGEELKAKTKEQLKMLRDQEKSIGKLEEEKQELAKEIERRDQQIEKLKLEAEFVAEKSQASAGLVASLGDTDKQLAEAKRQLVAMLGERDRAREEAQDLRARLTTARTELTKTRDLLSEQATPGAAGKLLREQIRQLEIQLEKESQKRRLLEELLSKGETLATTPAATATDVPRPLPQAADRVEVYEGATFPEAAEREKRAAQRQLLARGFLRQGVAAEKEGNVEAARWNYGKVLENDPDNHTATQRLGLIAAELKQDKEAIRYLKRAFRLDPDNRDILLPLGFALVRQSEPDLAVSMLSRAVALEPDNADAHRYLGVACSTLGWYGAAEVQFRRTFELNPDDADNAFNLAALLATREPPRLEEAKTWYLRARKLGAAAEPGLDQMFGLTGEAGE
jgi:tetratricopeptide (TPR) repeat protein